MVPYARLQEAIAERNELRGQLLEAKTQIAGFANERAALEVRIRDAEAAREWAGHETALAREGITDRDVVDYVKFQHGKAEGKDGKPPAFDAWWQGYRDSKPAVLAPFLDKTGATAKPAGAAATIDAGAKPVGSGAKVDPSTMTNEQYKAWRATPDGQAALKGPAFGPRGG